VAQIFPLTIVLDNIRSAYNVGAILRVAECAGLTEVITCGYTPSAGHPKVKKTSLDAENLVETRHFTDLNSALTTLTHEGLHLYALESGKNTQSLWEIELPRVATAIIFGNEVEGIQLDILKQFTVPLVQIPMYGQKESLNVSTAMAIASYDIIKRWSTIT